MLTHKPIRERGKIRLSEYCKILNEGERVSVVKELSMQNNLPKRIQGKIGIVKRKIGSAYLVNINEGKKIKGFIMHPVHLRRMGGEK
ncbi:MAG: 50S ribosomal protein L21e [Nanoarchaeota archaeon]